jgi:hypothetical protein
MNLDAITKCIDTYYQKEETSLWAAFNQLFLFISAKQFSQNTDIYYLGKVLSYDQIKKLSEYYEGGSIRFPSSDELKNCYTLSVCFFLEQVLGWSWPQIREYFKESKIDLNTVSYGIQTKRLKTELAKEMQILFDRIDKSKEKEFVEEVKKSGKEEK